MMNNRFAGETLSLLRRFADAGIRMECQLVLCPGWNDGEELERSMHDLAVLAPAVESVAVVPVGLTKYRQGLTPLRPFTKEESAQVIEAVERFGGQMLAATGNRLVYPADEWYIAADRPIPEQGFYGEFSQLENGVGLVALLRSQFTEAMESGDASPSGTDTVLVTGVAAAPVLQELVNAAQQRWEGIRARVFAVKNDFFGETITVAGLVTGGDILRQLAGVQCERILIPEVMLRREGDRLLDDVTPEELEETLGVRVQVVPVDGAALLDALLER
jgi:putative radical SAM enzyme (TIGR03279 family)